MADEPEVTNETPDSAEDQQGQDGEAQEARKKGRFDTSSLLAWAIIAVLVSALSAGAGVAAGIVSQGRSAPEPQAGPEQGLEDAPSQDQGETRIGDFAYYEFEPLTVNLDVVRQNRYIKVTVVLAIPKADEAEVVKTVEDKKIELKNWIMTYMAGHTLEQVAGRKNMVRIQREICDTLNDKLWPNHRPRIDHVLFKDYAVQ